MESVARVSTNSHIQDIAALFKLRLAALVVFSAVLGYLMGTDSPLLVEMIALSVGGFLLTGASNGLNQVWERKIDALMERTKDRPLPTGRMSVTTAVVYSLIAGVVGISLLFVLCNVISGILGLLALFSYVFIYTPLKKSTSLAVFVGAFPGAIPPMLGYVAASHTFGLEAGLLFAIQFMWQFPHFWAIAWVAHDDYAKAGYRLLPFLEGKSHRSAYQILLYTLFLVPVSILPWALPSESPMIGSWAMGVTLACGTAFSLFAWKLAKLRTDKAAKALMFASFAYLPLVQIVFVLDKI